MRPTRPNGKWLHHNGTVRTTREEEIALGRRIRDGDQAARDELISRNLPLCLTIAKRYRTETLTLNDLCEEGVIGLCKAADKWDPDEGARFGTYAYWWIRQSIAYAAERKGPFLGVSRKRYRELTADNMPRTYHASECAIDPWELGEGGEEPRPYDAVQRMAVAGLLESIEPSRRWCVRRIIMEGATLREVGEELGITRERVRQLCASGLHLLKQRVDRKQRVMA